MRRLIAFGSGRMTLALRLALVSTAVLISMLGAQLFGLGSLAWRDAQARGDEELLGTTQAAAKLLSAYYDDAQRKSREDFDILLSDFGWTARLDELDDRDGNRRRLLAGERDAVDAANAKLDRFADITGADATVYARSGDDFVRVATSLRTREGTRATGLLMERTHPAYAKIAQGVEFAGLSYVFRRFRMGRYVPIVQDGKVVGAVVAGSPLVESLNALGESMQLLHPLKVGLVYAIMLAPGPTHGRVIGLPGSTRVASDEPAAEAFLRSLQEADAPALVDAAWTPALAAADAGAARPAQRLAVMRDPRWDIAVVSEASARDITRPALHMITVMVGADLAVLAILILCMFLLARHYVAKPLDTLIAGLGRFSEKDLTQTLRLDRHDEIGRLSESMEAFRLQLLGALCAVQENAGSLSEASTRIAAGSKNLSLRTIEQIDLLKYTFSSMAQLNERLRSSAQSAEQATELAREASRRASLGGADVERFVRTMEGINRSSKTIEGIVAVIDGIAFQTNILALNAAVEAARAGEQGRGFAVVASEVRLLARRCTDAAREIKDLVAGSVGQVDEGVRVVEQAGRSIAEVVQATQRVSELFETIRASSHEQEAGIHSVEEAVTCLDRATQQNVGLVNESASAAESLMGQAQGLQQAIGVFRLVEDGAAAAH